MREHGNFTETMHQNAAMTLLGNSATHLFSRRKLVGAVAIELFVALKTRKLLILGNAKRMKNRKNAELRYTRGTQSGPEFWRETA